MRLINVKMPDLCFAVICWLAVIHGLWCVDVIPQQAFNNCRDTDGVGQYWRDEGRKRLLRWRAIWQENGSASAVRKNL